jgi:hypothetical protein
MAKIAATTVILLWKQQQQDAYRALSTITTTASSDFWKQKELTVDQSKTGNHSGKWLQWPC